MLNPLNLSRGFGPESATNDLSVATTQNPLAGNLLQAPQRPENIDKQYFYNKDLNKLFNMSGGARMAAPKGFESVNKNQYEDFASKGATLQGYSMFNDAMGGGYNLDLPRLTSGPNSGGLDRNSPEYLYYHGDDQKTKLGLGNLSGIGAMIPEQGPLGPGLVGGRRPLPDLGINDSKFIGINPDSITSEAGPLSEIPLSMQQPIPGLGAPPQGIGSLTPTPQQPMMPTMPGNTMPENTMGGINSLSEFGKPPSLGGNNSFGNPFMGNILGGNNSFQPNQQSFNDNQGLNSYVDNMVNGRLKDIFGGIMGLFK